MRLSPLNKKSYHRSYYYYFGKAVGIETTKMNGGCKPYAMWLENNHFSFPTMDGLLWIIPEKAAPLFTSQILLKRYNSNDYSVLFFSHIQNYSYFHKQKVSNSGVKFSEHFTHRTWFDLLCFNTNE